MSLVRNVKLVLRGFAWGALATSVCVFAVVQFANPDMTPVHLLLTYWALFGKDPLLPTTDGAGRWGRL